MSNGRSIFGLGLCLRIMALVNLSPRLPQTNDPEVLIPIHQDPSPFVHFLGQKYDLSYGEMGSLGTYEIVRLDMGSLSSPSAEVRERFCMDLVYYFSYQGMVKLVNHGIPRKVVEESFEWNRKFFKLPRDEKHAIAHPQRANPNRGWVEIGQEKSSAIKDFEKGVVNNGPAVFDVKESFDQGSPNDPLYDNKWPSQASLPGFREFMESFYDHCQDVHMRLLHALNQGFRAQGINIDLVEKCKDNVSELRLNHYPRIDIRDIRKGSLCRISEHTDFGTVTLLLQDSVGGLEVEDQTNIGHYIPVEAKDMSEMLVNVGDSLQRLTNDVLTSVSHRVKVPVSLQAREEGELAERYSIAYFAKVSRDQILKPMPEFVKNGEKAKYEDISAWDWNQLKLQRIYG